MCVFHLSEKIHSINAKIKPNIPWIIGEVLLMGEVEMFPLPTIFRMSNLSIHIALYMPKQELSIHWIGEYTLQAVDHR
jgi:hypothetical protein